MNNTATDPYVRNIPNTFLPDCVNQVFSINDLITAVRLGFVSLERIPPDIAHKVHLEIEKRFRGKDKSPIRA